MTTRSLRTCVFSVMKSIIQGISARPGYIDWKLWRKDSTMKKKKKKKKKKLKRK